MTGQTSWTPTPREGCPERCQGHYAPCEHRTGYVACDDCIAQRGKDGPVWCSAFTEAEVTEAVKALNAPSCCGTPDPNAKTLREWEAEANARRCPPLPLRTRVGIRVAEAISCPACFRLRLSPGHLLFCGGSL